MKILFISRFGDSYGLATKMAEQGHTVWYWIEDLKYRGKGQGFNAPERVQHYQPYLKKADFIVFDMSGLGSLADTLKKQGMKVIGASDLADKLESDRNFASETVKKYCKDVNVPEYKEFKGIEKGISFLEGQDKLFVFKPYDMPTAWTFVPRKGDNTATISIMKLCPKKNCSFILQEKVEGIEISTEGWFDGKNWIKGSFNHTIEHKRFMDGDKGSNCGCTGNVVWACGEDKLVSSFLLPLTELLRKANHVGPVDVNAIVNKEAIHFLEFSCRFGYDAVQALSMLTEDFGEFLKDVIDGNAVELEDGYASAVRLSMPPYPFSEDNAEAASATKGMKVVDVYDSLKPYVMLVDVMKKDDETVMAGSDNVVGVVCSLADAIDESMDTVYNIIDEIIISNDVQNRDDIGKGTDVKIAKLTEWGFLDAADSD